MNEVVIDENSELSKKSRWYIVHTYSGFEQRVQKTINEMIRTGQDEGLIQEVIVPTEKVMELGKGGEKNLGGAVSDLQMRGYLVIRDFRRRINKRGEAYGWPIAVYAMPETLWGYDHIAAAYALEPAASKARIYEQVRRCFPAAAPAAVERVLEARI